MPVQTLFGVALGLFLVMTPASLVGAEPTNARLATFRSDDQSYFALSLRPEIVADPTQRNDVAILLDTSASQTGKYRLEQLTALNSLLAELGAGDRVQLWAVDMKAISMSAGFVSARSAEMETALTMLNRRTPLGATDLDAGIRLAAASLSANGNAKSIIYVGDAMSRANLFTEATLRNLITDMRNQHVSVSSYVLGQATNPQLMAALANHTGGMVQVDGPEAEAATASGRVLAARNIPCDTRVGAGAGLLPCCLAV